MKELEELEAGSRKKFPIGGQPSNSILLPMCFPWTLTVLQTSFTSVVQGRLHVALFVFALLCDLVLGLYELMW